jgi:hypothetical protein
MPIARRYQSFEVREMLQRAEHAPSPVTGIDAHSRSLHAMRTPHGVGVDQAEMLHRTHKMPAESNKQFKNRGGAVRTSTFPNLLQQADAACQALNSPLGQRALSVLDSPVHAGKNLRLTLEFGPIREAGFLPASGAPHMHTVHKNDAKVQAPAGGATGVCLIADRGAGGTALHMQTCYPLDALPVSKFVIRDMTAQIDIMSG